MTTAKLLLLLICVLILTMGVVSIYNARELAQKWFSSSEQNTISKYLKMVGAIASIGAALCIVWQLHT